MDLVRGTMELTSCMTCEACAVHVRSALAEVSGVRDISVSYADGHARLTVDAESPPSSDMLIEAVSKAGYTATSRSGG